MATITLKPSLKGQTLTVAAKAEGRNLASVFYEFAGDLHPSDAGIANAALVGFMPYAMRKGMDIFVEGAVDVDLLEALEEAQDAWSLWHPTRFKAVSISAEETRAQKLPETRSAVIAFSGGLDASYALHAHKKQIIGRRSLDVKAAALVHGFDLPLDREDWFLEARKKASAITTSYDVPLVTVRTNWRSIGAPWEQSFIFAISSVIHQFKGVFGHGIIAADETYDGEILGWGSNSITNQLMSGPSFPLHFTGAGKWRTEKARSVGPEKAVIENLRVCWERPDSLGNCGKCEKCLRTKLNFQAVGVLDIPALGDPVTANQIREIKVTSNAVMNLFIELSRYPWSDQPEIKAALIALTSKGTQKSSKISRVLKKAKRKIIAKI